MKVITITPIDKTSCRRETREFHYTVNAIAYAMDFEHEALVVDDDDYLIAYKLPNKDLKFECKKLVCSFICIERGIVRFEMSYLIEDELIVYKDVEVPNGELFEEIGTPMTSGYQVEGSTFDGDTFYTYCDEVFAEQSDCEEYLELKGIRYEC